MTKKILALLSVIIAGGGLLVACANSTRDEGGPRIMTMEFEPDSFSSGERVTLVAKVENVAGGIKDAEADLDFVGGGQRRDSRHERAVERAMRHMEGTSGVIKAEVAIMPTADPPLDIPYHLSITAANGKQSNTASDTAHYVR